MDFFYVPAYGTVVPQYIDEAIKQSDGSYLGRFSGKTLEQMRERYPTIAIADVKDIEVLREEMLRSEPVPCTEEQFNDALECLPPVDWINAAGYETFKLEERFSGRITDIYVRSGEFFYSFKDIDTLTHSEIIERVQQSKHFGQKASATAEVTS